MTGDVPTRAVRVPADLRIEAAARLVGPGRGNPRTAARRLLAELERHSYANDLLFARIDASARPGSQVGPVCMAVPSAGRAAMLFMSAPGDDDAAADSTADHAGRVDAIRSALVGLAALPGSPVGLAQALPDPGEAWAVRALDEAGMVRVGDLLYLRGRLTPSGGGSDEHADDLPAGVTIRAMSAPGVEPAGPMWAALMRALERSYIDTRDCPKLCGMRSIEDVVASHRSVGVFDGSLWYLIEAEGRPEGCCLVSRGVGGGSGSPAGRQSSTGAELVYMGIGPALRGLGIGRRVLERAMRRATQLGEDTMTCAVDEQNQPARRLYTSMGFAAFASRVGFVRQV